MPSQGNDLFLHLTPERVLDAVETGGLRSTGLCYPLNSFENRVYEVELEDASRVVAKFYRPLRWSTDQILEEHAFLDELDAEEIPVCTMRPFPDGSTLKTVDGIHYSLSDRRGGRAPDELNGETARRLGMLIGRLHTVACRREWRHRPRLDADRYVRAALGWIDAEGSIPADLRSRYFEAAEAIAKIAEERMVDVPVHGIHADLHLGNVLFRDQDLSVLDFDDMATGPAVQDLWLAIGGRDDESLALRAQLIAGYEQFHLFDHATLSLIEPLRALRMVRYVGWLARRWHDPAFKVAWPHFGTDDYWLRETDDLEEQLRVVRKAVVTGPAEVVSTADGSLEDPELTNKDFFWDWEAD